MMRTPRARLGRARRRAVTARTRRPDPGDLSLSATPLTHVEPDAGPLTARK